MKVNNPEIKKVLFIGAGASHGARGRMLCLPPLGSCLKKWLIERGEESLNNVQCIAYQTLLENGVKIIKNQSNENYESMFESLKSDERIAVHRLIQFLFSDLTCNNLNFGFNNLHDCYDELIKKLKISSKSWAVISINYDILIEEAFERNNIKIKYPFFEYEEGDSSESEEVIKIYKPHGSINFFSKIDYEVKYGSNDFERKDLKPTSHSVNTRGEISVELPIVKACKGRNVLPNIYPSSIWNPVMANYTDGKNSEINASYLEKIRIEACQACDVTDEILIIGVKPESNLKDPFIGKLLSKKYKKITYVTKCNSDRTDYQIIKCKFPHSIVYENGFEDFLNSK